MTDPHGFNEPPQEDTGLGKVILWFVVAAVMASVLTGVWS